MNNGLWIVGEFRGVIDGDYGVQLHVRTGEPTKRNPEGFTERLDFRPFNPDTGEALLPEGLELGQTVAVQYEDGARSGTSQRGDRYALVTKRALEVLVGRPFVQSDRQPALGD